MLFSVLIYDSEAHEETWPESLHAERLAQHEAFQEPLREKRKLGACVKLMGTSTAVTLRGPEHKPTVLDKCKITVNIY